ncbi:HMG box protein [Diplocarpon rosae]|nr:HMG box protein [Diplocarpon rosae]
MPIMLSIFGRALAQRIVARGPQSTNRALRGVWQFKHVNFQNSTPSQPRFVFSLKRKYSTATRVPKPTAKTSKVSKPKPKETKEKSTKKVATKKRVKKPIKKKVSKKPVVKKPVKKVLNDKQKAAAAKRKAYLELKALKATALRLPKPKSSTVWSVYVTKTLNDKDQPHRRISKALGDQYRLLSPSDLELYEKIALQNKAENEAAYEKFVASHDPDKIRLANNARHALRILAPRSSWPLIRDPRMPKRPVTSWMLYVTDRYASGDYKDVPFLEATTLLKKEFTALKPSERQVYEDRAAASKAQYVKEYRETFKRDPLFISKAAAAAGSSP